MNFYISYVAYGVVCIFRYCIVCVSLHLALRHTLSFEQCKYVTDIFYE